MPKYLIGIMYHEPESFDQWNRGLIEDFESATGLFVEAASAEEATAWGEVVGQELLKHFNQDCSLDWRALGYYCWVEASPETGCWGHCLGFFQIVGVGEMPNLDDMGAVAYGRWRAAT